MAPFSPAGRGTLQSRCRGMDRGLGWAQQPKLSSLWPICIAAEGIWVLFKAAFFSPDSSFFKRSDTMNSGLIILMGIGIL